MIEKGLDPERIAGAEKLALPAVPDRKCKVAEQLLYATLAPAFIGGEDQLAIRDFALRTARGPARIDEFPAIVDAGVAGDGQSNGRVVQREVLPKRLGSGVQHAVAQADMLVAPNSDSVGSAMPQPAEHSPDIRVFGAFTSGLKYSNDHAPSALSRVTRVLADELHRLRKDNPSQASRRQGNDAARPWL